MQCNTSSITVINPVCKLRLIRVGSIVSLGSEVTKDISHGSVSENMLSLGRLLIVLNVLKDSLTGSYKVYNNWRQIVKILWTPICDILHSTSPVIKSFIQSIQIFFFQNSHTNVRFIRAANRLQRDNSWRQSIVRKRRLSVFQDCYSISKRNLPNQKLF